MSLREHFLQRVRTLVPIGMALLLSSPAPGQQASYDPHKFMIARSHYTKAMKLLADNKLSEGEAELLEAVKTFPQLAEGYVELGNLSMNRGEFREGLERYLKAREALSELQGIKRLQEVERQRRIQESIDLLNERIGELSRSQNASDQGKIQQAMVHLEKLQQEKINAQPPMESPFTPEVHFLVGTALMKLERFEEAAKEFQDALTLRPNFGEAHNNLAVVLYYRRDYPACWVHLRAAELAGIRVDPQFKEELSAIFPEPETKPAP
jgi:tetratricopeptide (TPR) repeat protein